MAAVKLGAANIHSHRASVKSFSLGPVFFQAPAPKVPILVK
jgi:hypothetical protein